MWLFTISIWGWLMAWWFGIPNSKHLLLRQAWGEHGWSFQRFWSYWLFHKAEPLAIPHVACNSQGIKWCWPHPKESLSCCWQCRGAAGHEAARKNREREIVHLPLHFFGICGMTVHHFSKGGSHAQWPWCCWMVRSRLWPWMSVRLEEIGARTLQS